jgi:hypothetical protein
MTLRNIEGQEFKLNSRQAAIYIGSIVGFTFAVAGAYFGINAKLDRLIDQQQSTRTTVSSNTDRISELEKSGNVRYYEIIMKLETKEDKKK